MSESLHVVATVFKAVVLVVLAVILLVAIADKDDGL